MIPIKSIVDLAVLCLQFGRVNRVTYHEDGKTPESDTDHTVMLGVVGCAYAAWAELDLDLGKVAQFALVHDLVEALCGDTNTLRASEGARKAKEERERAAFEQLRERFVDLPWVAQTIAEYESLSSKEARYVKVLDKVLPKLTHALNLGAALREHEVRLADLSQVNGSQREQIGKTYGADQHAAMALLYAAHDELVSRLAVVGFDDMRTDSQPVPESLPVAPGTKP